MAPPLRQRNCSRRQERAGWLAGRNSGALPIRAELQLRILQANSSTTVGTSDPDQPGFFIAGYAIAWFFVSMVLIDIAAGQRWAAALRNSFLQAFAKNQRLQRSSRGIH
jgi:hypothetical protein